ncbi:hypothetical protein F5144DRAFT_484053 [Chaetomium tenue]|uniref:Uncharacterized protein n=1 Tax=Chaetomium tenue TaxID=1854479 RepID=A0ACB7PIP2_9PEZI|nr:hypothetical protein F5144DRAFT_484053 [Chaetomium globosum]
MSHSSGRPLSSSWAAQHPNQSDFRESTQSSCVDLLFNDLNIILPSNPPHGIGLPAYANPSELLNDRPKLDLPTENTGYTGGALTGVRSLLEGVEAEFQRFNNVSSKSTSPATLRLRSRFRSSKELAHDGMLVCRDLSEGLPPDTLEEVFAVACVSHAMSQILVGQKRMEETQVLSGLQQWKEGIETLDERSDFDALASEMWPSRYTSSTRPEQSASGPHVMEGIDLPGGQDNTLHLPPGAAEMGQVSQDALPAGDTRPSVTALGGNTLELWANRTPGAFGFSQLRHVDGGYSYVPRNDIDPRELFKFCSPNEHIPGYNPSPPHSPGLEAPPPAPVLAISGCESPPARPSLTSLPCDDQDHYYFPIVNEVFYCKAINLRNTITFLAVLGFAGNDDYGFYQLAGNGMTVEHRKIGSVWDRERLETEKRLRSEFFDPLKEAETEDAGFRAMLAVAEMFVRLGLLGTREKVQDFLIAISKFIRWILFGKPPDSVTAFGNKPTQQRDPVQRNKRRGPLERQLDEERLAKKKQ